MSNIHRKPIPSPVPDSLRHVGNKPTELARRMAARRLPWSRFNPQQRALALRTIIVGREAYR